jgi:hypothetical protein
MFFPIEVMLRETHQVIAEQGVVSEDDPARWTEEHAREILTAMLSALDRAKNPGRDTDSTPPVSLRGLSWIVTPYREGSALAMDIYSGQIVAGPFPVSEEALNALVTRALAGPGSPGGGVH